MGCGSSKEMGGGAVPTGKSRQQIINRRITQAKKATKRYPDLTTRKWFQLSKSTQPTMKVLQYNILGDIYCGRDEYLGGFAIGWNTNTEKNEAGYEAMQWKYRGERLLQEILQQDPDLMCLVELDAPHDKDWAEKNFGPLGYDVIYAKCNPLGSMLVYRRDKFETTGDPQIFEVDAKKGPFGLYAPMRWRQTGVEFGIMASHLKSGEKDKDFIKRKAQVDHLLEQIPRDLPLIWGLDMNSPPEGKTYHAVMTDESLNLLSTYSKLPASERMQEFEHTEGGLTVREPEYTTWKLRKAGTQADKVGKEFCRTIDYIFVNREQFEVTGLLGFPPENTMQKGTFLPDMRYPSDHYATVAEIQLRPDGNRSE